MLKILFILILSLSAIADTFVVQSKLSKINFSVDKLFFIGVDGEFTKFKGKIVVEDNKVSTINGRVDATSVNTYNKDRDEDLKGNGYFETTEFKYIDFKAIGIDEQELQATITIKGITKKIKFTIDEMKLESTKITLKISSVVNRQDFLLDGPFGSVISNNVKVSASLFAYIE